MNISKNQTVLIVEDEPDLAALLEQYLINAGYQAHVIGNGLEVESWVEKNQPQLIVLDLMLPGKPGLDICKSLRQCNQTPIIITTAKVEEIDRLLGLELGADDYICKPFSPFFRRNCHFVLDATVPVLINLQMEMVTTLQ